MFHWIFTWLSNQPKPMNLVFCLSFRLSLKRHDRRHLVILVCFIFKISSADSHLYIFGSTQSTMTNYHLIRMFRCVNGSITLARKFRFVVVFLTFFIIFFEQRFFSISLSLLMACVHFVIYLLLFIFLRRGSTKCFPNCTKRSIKTIDTHTRMRLEKKMFSEQFIASVVCLLCIYCEIHGILESGQGMKSNHTHTIARKKFI